MASVYLGTEAPGFTWSGEAGMLTMEKVVETGGDLQDLELPVLPSSSCPLAVPVWQAREAAEEGGA